MQQLRTELQQSLILSQGSLASLAHLTNRENENLRQVVLVLLRNLKVVAALGGFLDRDGEVVGGGIVVGEIVDIVNVGEEGLQ